MGASQGKKNAKKKDDADLTLDPEASAALSNKLAANNRRGNNRQMPWNEDEDSDMNDREGVDNR